MRIHAFLKRMAVPRIGDSAVRLCLGKPTTDHQTGRDHGHFRSALLIKSAAVEASRPQCCIVSIAALHKSIFIFRRNMVQHTHRHGFSSSHSRSIGSTTLLLPVVDRVYKPDGSSPVGLSRFRDFPRSVYSALSGCAPLRIAVELRPDRGPWMKVQAGARFFQRTRASSSSMRAKSKVRVIFEER